MASDRSAFLSHKDVPYVTDSVSQAARAHLPATWDVRLNQERIDAFTRAAKEDPETRAAVLSVLRTHAANGSELPLALAALLVTALGSLAAASAALAPWFAPAAWILVAGAVMFMVWTLRRIGAIHARKLLAIAWLGAYTDALRDAERAEDLAARDAHRVRRRLWAPPWRRSTI